MQFAYVHHTSNTFSPEHKLSNWDTWTADEWLGHAEEFAKEIAYYALGSPTPGKFRPVLASLLGIQARDMDSQDHRAYGVMILIGWKLRCSIAHRDETTARSMTLASLNLTIRDQIVRHKGSVIGAVSEVVAPDGKVRHYVCIAANEIEATTAGQKLNMELIVANQQLCPLANSEMVRSLKFAMEKMADHFCSFVVTPVLND
jgi:hypothetical protein